MKLTISTAILTVIVFAIFQYLIACYAIPKHAKPTGKQPKRAVMDEDYNIGMTCARCGADFVEVDGKLKCPRCANDNHKN